MNISIYHKLVVVLFSNLKNLLMKNNNIWIFNMAKLLAYYFYNHYYTYSES